MNSINEKYRQMYISSDVKFYTISELKEMIVWSENTMKI